MEFENIAKREKIAWRQRSRATWLKQGARNIGFFHKTANAHRRMNTIAKLKVRGETLSNHEEEQEEKVTFYEKLYSETDDWRPNLEMRNCPMIGADENHLLMAPIEEQEILQSIKSCAGDRAQGQMVSLCLFSASVGTLSNLIWWLQYSISRRKKFLKEASMLHL